jgi:hypothetical protein
VRGGERGPIKKDFSEVVEKLGTTILPLLANTDKAFTCNQKESRDQERVKGEVANICVLVGWYGGVKTFPTTGKNSYLTGSMM